jgi:hypothetical protein
MDLEMLVDKIQNAQDEITLNEKDLKIMNEQYENEVTPLELAILTKQFNIADKLIREGGAVITGQAFKDIQPIISRLEKNLKYNQLLLKNCRDFRTFMQKTKEQQTKQKKT